MASIFTSQTPAAEATGNTSPFELGTRFTSDVDGQVTHLKFYKTAGNTGVHVGHLWDAGGSLLASATFTGETASGWQSVELSPPVDITAGLTYTVSYSTSAAFGFTSGGFTAGIDNAPLHAPAAAGKYAGASNTYPTNVFGDSNYFADVTFVEPSEEPPAGDGTDAEARMKIEALKNKVGEILGFIDMSTEYFPEHKISNVLKYSDGTKETI